MTRWFGGQSPMKWVKNAGTYTHCDVTNNKRKIRNFPNLS